ncbi:uncharacterized protein DUF4270 [Breznakibacter xylanolyticus]|uniref:Uncharacterized protein DUF4270 n=2 Tax=Breznakibacter xylanolyticus TaxID=990 RepID=A0A2W7P4T7_9BACT|nr:uncharacterized protein DUF4270 [Breznakibacter xylanolyticus]
MKMYMRKKWLEVFAGVFLSGLMMTGGFGCSSGDQDGVDVGGQFIESSTYAEMIDSVSIRFSTIRVDSIQTSGMGVALVGTHLQPGVGTSSAHSYMAMTYSAGIPDEKEIFDSLTMVLKYSGYCKGDTMQPFILDVYRMNEMFESKNADRTNYYFNNQSFTHDTDPVGSHAFWPQPNVGKKIVEFRLSDDLGQEVWSFINTKPTEGTTIDDIFKGFVLKGDHPDNKALLGFSMSDTLGYIKVYSHKVGSEIQEISRRITLKGTSYQFNHIDLELENSQLAGKIESGEWTELNRLDEADNLGMSLTHAGTGFQTRVDIPYLERLVAFKDMGRFVKAVLYVRPAEGTYELNNLPSAISIGLLNKVNGVEQYYTDANKKTLTGNLVKDGAENVNTYYSYDVTSYLNTMLANYEYYKDYGLVLTIPSESFNSSVDGIAFAGGSLGRNSRSFIKLFYYSYDQERR